MPETILTSTRQLTTLLVKAQKDVFNRISGENNTQTKGIGYDFVELRAYSHTDDAKHIDWIISSKLQKPYVKLFQEQRELNVSIVPVLNASVNFGLNVSKQDKIAEISALLSFACVRQNNPFLSYICNEDTTLSTKKSKALMGVKELVEKIFFYKTFGKSINYQLLSGRLYRDLKQKSMIFLIGDFFHTEEFDIATLGIKHEIVVIIVRDKFEENPLAIGDLHVIDPETQESAYVTIDERASLKIAQEVAGNDADFYAKLKKNGVKFIKIYTDEDPANKIVSLMKSLV